MNFLIKCILIGMVTLAFKAIYDLLNINNLFMNDYTLLVGFILWTISVSWLAVHIDIELLKTDKK